jgi:flagellar hook-associated protein 1 FlgK
MTSIPPTSIFGSLQIGARALLAQQSVLNTIGHNLANATTPGYSRQQVEMVPTAPQAGVDVAGIRRLRDRFLDLSFLNENQALGRNQADAGTLARLETIFNDPADSGLSATLDQFYQSFQDLSASPTDQALRVTVVQAGSRLASTFQGMNARINQLRTDLTAEIQNRVGDANNLITQIADAQRQIVESQATGASNDLLDRRDQLVNQLSQIIGVSASDRPDGTVQLAIAGTGVLLIDGMASAPLAATLNATTDTIELTAGTVTTPLTPASGALAANLAERNSATGAVRQATADLNTLARAIIDETNKIHAGGTGLTEHTALTSVNAVSSPAAALTAAGLSLTPVTGSFRVIVHDSTGAVTASATVPVTAGTTTLNDLATAIGGISGLTATVSSGKLTIAAGAGQTFTFADDTSNALAALGLNTFFTGTGAADFAVNPLVANDVTKVTAARADAAGLVHAGDGSNALAAARLRTALTMTSGASTFTDFYAKIVSRVGALARDANSAVDRQQAAVQLVQSLQQQTSGVSTDEELVNLTQAQTAYGAAARYISTIQTLLDTLLTITQ